MARLPQSYWIRGLWPRMTPPGGDQSWAAPPPITIQYISRMKNLCHVSASRALTVYLLASLVFCFTVSSHAKPGDLDRSFGAGLGYEVTPPLVDRRADDLQATAILADGRILAAGWCDGDDYSGTGKRHCVRRYLSNGALDRSFGADGVSMLFAGWAASGSAQALAVQPDGRVLVAGYCRGQAYSLFDGFPASLLYSEQYACIVRLTPDGAFDATFGKRGKLVFALHYIAGVTSGYSSADSIALLSDGRFLVGGSCSNGSSYVLALCASRHMPDGAFDKTFNSVGWQIAPVAGVTSSQQDVRIILDPTGDGFLLAGACQENAALYRYAVCLISRTASGAARTAFGSSSGNLAFMPLAPLVSGMGLLDAVAFDSNTFLIAGYCVENGLLVRYRPCVTKLDRATGAHDVSWGPGGIIFADSTSDIEWIGSLTVDERGNFYVSGSDPLYASALGRGFRVAKYLPTGAPDTTFGTANVARVSGCVGGSDNFVRSTALTAGNKKLLVAGRSYVGGVRGVFCLGRIHTHQDYFDLDNDNESNPAGDGVLYLRHLLGFRDSALTTGALGTYADRTFGADVATYLSTPNASYPNCSANIVGAAGGPSAMLDGIVLMRAMFGLTGTAVTNGINFPVGTVRTTWSDIKAHLNTNCGMALN